MAAAASGGGNIPATTSQVLGTPKVDHRFSIPEEAARRIVEVAKDHLLDRLLAGSGGGDASGTEIERAEYPLDDSNHLHRQLCTTTREALLTRMKLLRENTEKATSEGDLEHIIKELKNHCGKEHIDALVESITTTKRDGEQKDYLLALLDVLINPKKYIAHLHEVSPKKAQMTQALIWLDFFEPGIKDSSLSEYETRIFPGGTPKGVDFHQYLDLPLPELFDILQCTIKKREHQKKWKAALETMRRSKQAPDFEEMCKKGLPPRSEWDAIKVEKNAQKAKIFYHDRYFPGKYTLMEKGFSPHRTPLLVEYEWTHVKGYPDLITNTYFLPLETATEAALQLNAEHRIHIDTAESQEEFAGVLKHHCMKKDTYPFGVLAKLDPRGHVTPFIFLPKPTGKFQVAILGSAEAYEQVELDGIAPHLKYIAAVYKIRGVSRQADAKSCYIDGLEILKNVLLEIKENKSFSFEDFKKASFSPRIPGASKIPFSSIRQPLRWQPFAQVISAMDDRDDPDALAMRNGYLIPATVQKKYSPGGFEETIRKIICIGLAVRSIQVGCATTAGNGIVIL